MTKTSRRTLFYGLVLLFLLGGTAVVLYAQGWRLDVSRRRLTQVGGIYVRSIPADVRIVLDGHPTTASRRFFDDGVLLNDLFPKSYTVTLEKDGYRPLRRTVSVNPASVAEVRYGVLVPETATVAGPASWLWPAGRGAFVVRTTSGTLAVGGREFANGTIAPEGGAGGFVLATRSIPVRYAWIDALTGTSTDVTALFGRVNRLLGAETGAERIAIERERGAAIAVWSGRAIATADVAAGTAALVTPPGSRGVILDAALSGGMLLYAASADASATSTLFLYRQASRWAEPFAPSVEGKTARISWIDDVHAAFLQDTGALFSRGVGESAVRKLADGVRLFSVADDGSRIAAVGKESMEVLSLDGKKNYWRFNLPDIDAIRSVSWYRDGRHLFLHYPNRVLFLDLDDAGLENLTLVAETERGFYDAGANAFRFVDGSERLRVMPFEK